MNIGRSTANFFWYPKKNDLVEYSDDDNEARLIADNKDSVDVKEILIDKQHIYMNMLYS